MNPWALVISAVFSSSVIAAVIGYVRDRRKVNADADVAVETKELRVDAAKLADLEHRLQLMSEAFDQERGAKDRTIAALTEDNRRMHDEIAAKDAELGHLRTELERLQDQLNAMRERVDRILPDHHTEQPETGR